MSKEVEQAPHGTGVVFTLDNGTKIQVLHWDDSVRITNITQRRPNTTGLSVRVRQSNMISVSEAR